MLLTLRGGPQSLAPKAHGEWVGSGRVTWVPVSCFPTLPLRPFAMYVAFLRSDYYGLFDCLEGFGVSLGSRLPTVHPPLHPFQALPCSKHRNQNKILKVACFSLPLQLSLGR